MTSYRYLGYGTTDSNGVAHYTYTGTGAGEVDVIASLDNPISQGSIVSETLSIYDTLWYDTAITGTDKIWHNTDATTLSVDITPTGTVLSSSASNKRYYANNNNSYGDFTCEFEVVEHTADYTSFVCGNSVISTRLNQALTGSTVKIVREGSTFKQYVNGELVDSQTDTATTSRGIGFRCNANDSIKFKNFKIW